MEGTLHTLALIFVVLVSMAICCRYGTKPLRTIPVFVILYGAKPLPIIPTFVILIAVIPIILKVFVSSVPPLWHFLVNNLDEPPISLVEHQWAILGICLGLLLYTVPYSRMKKLVVVAVFIGLAVMFSLHLNRLLTLPGYELDRTAYGLTRDRDRGRAIEITTPADWHSWLIGVSRREVVDLFMPAPRTPTSLPRDEKINDRQGDYNAVGLLIVLMASLAMMIGYTGRGPMRGEYSWRVTYSLALFVVAIMMIAPQWTFAPQWVIPALCLGVIVGWVQAPKRLLIGYAAFILVIGFVLSEHVRQLTEGQYSYDRMATPWLNYRNSEAGVLADMRTMLTSYAYQDKRTYPAGWLEGSEFWRENHLFYKSYIGIQQYPQTRPAWHSRLTRIYRNTGQPCAIWYPGGTIREALPRIDYRYRSVALPDYRNAR